ncbi:type II toxin-antitoxin system RelE/ParE family toxin [Endozoicomonas sp. 8E]|uniref:type II toxin-antitoxin system RelE/ParE family toxin n=1 Tax=Endozoicomonas sp. 8E TaxID=3035692 RepID=UPI0029393050|nr:type II toxin-antitoxin system RelE/ParE family toxin [Endozoicomonas sp. 8E]WOG26386.1 type II toxin-antitoxin system RelE/ParE family toxin [Endozoicomonas sp. 8E]
MIKLQYTPEFKRSLIRLFKKYRSIREDLEPLLDTLAAGQTPGDRLQVSGDVLYKVRLRNKDSKRGKSVGYRVIYYLKAQKDIILVTLYSKTEQSDIQASEIQNIIDRYLR